MTTTTRTHIDDLANAVGTDLESIEALARQAAEDETDWYDEHTRTLSAECVELVTDHYRQTAGADADDELFVVLYGDAGTCWVTLEARGFRLDDALDPIADTSFPCPHGSLYLADRPALDWARTLGYEWDSQRHTADSMIIPVRRIRD